MIYRQPLLFLNVWQQLGLHSRAGHHTNTGVLEEEVRVKKLAICLVETVSSRRQLDVKNRKNVSILIVPHFSCTQRHERHIHSQFCRGLPPATPANTPWQLEQVAAESCSPLCCLQSNLPILAVLSWRAGRQGHRCSAGESRAWLQMKRQSGSYSPSLQAGLGSAAHFCAVSPWYSTAAVPERSRQVSSALGGCLSAQPAWPCSTSIGAVHPSHWCLDPWFKELLIAKDSPC